MPVMRRLRMIVRAAKQQNQVKARHVSLQEDTVDEGSKEEAQIYPDRAQGSQNCGENKESTITTECQNKSL